MDLEDEVTTLMNSEGLYNLTGYLVPGAPPTPDEITQQLETFAALLKGHRRAILHLAREIENPRAQ